jgi:TrmH family RNA methyltransferase
VKEISSVRNPAVQRYRSLRDPQGRRETGAAAAEGVRLLREALLSGAAVEQVFLSDRVGRQPGGEELLERLATGEAAGRWQCFSVSADLMERMAFTENPQGALTVFRPRRAALEEVVGAGAGPVVLLERLADPGNLGLILRTAEAAGASGVIVSPGTVDPFNPKAVRSSAGSLFRLPVVRADLPAAAVAAEAAGFRLFATTPHGGEEYTAARLSGKVGFLLGGEGSGLSPEFLGRFDGLRIPTGRVESLNVAMAAGVLLYEARRQRLRAAEADSPSAG